MLRSFSVLALAAILSFSCGDKVAVEDTNSSDNKKVESPDKATKTPVVDAAVLASDGQELEITCACARGGG